MGHYIIILHDSFARSFTFFICVEMNTFFDVLYIPISHVRYIYALNDKLSLEQNT